MRSRSPRAVTRAPCWRPPGSVTRSSSRWTRSNRSASVRTSDAGRRGGAEQPDALAGLAKEEGIGVLMTGHVTKDGDLAGPRALEHAVDVVLLFEGDAGPVPALSGGKNRFGAEGESAWFEMAPDGPTRSIPRVSWSRASGSPARPSRPHGGEEGARRRGAGTDGVGRRAGPPSDDGSGRPAVPADGGRARSRRRLPARPGGAVSAQRPVGSGSTIRPPTRRRGRPRVGGDRGAHAGRGRVRGEVSLTGLCDRSPACRSGSPRPRPQAAHGSSGRQPRDAAASASTPCVTYRRPCRGRTTARVTAQRRAS